jgi:hypothetical protein
MPPTLPGACAPATGSPGRREIERADEADRPPRLPDERLAGELAQPALQVRVDLGRLRDQVAVPNDPERLERDCRRDRVPARREGRAERRVVTDDRRWIGKTEREAPQFDIVRSNRAQWPSALSCAASASMTDCVLSIGIDILAAGARV